MGKTLIAYFSRADENYFGGSMRYVKVGNTEIAVNLMKEMMCADTFKIEMREPYSPAYMTCIEEAKRTFEKYRKCTLAYQREMKKGRSLESLAVKTVG